MDGHHRGAFYPRKDSAGTNRGLLDETMVVETDGVESLFCVISRLPWILLLVANATMESLFYVIIYTILYLPT